MLEDLDEGEESWGELERTSPDQPCEDPVVLENPVELAGFSQLPHVYMEHDPSCQGSTLGIQVHK